MNATNRLHLAIGLALVTLAGGAQSLLAAGNNPVCAPERDVSAVMGNGPAVIPQANCMTERKVIAGDTGPSVADVLGRGSPAQAAPQGQATAVSARSLGGAPVELVLGRSGHDIGGAVRAAASRMANSPQE